MDFARLSRAGAEPKAAAASGSAVRTIAGIGLLSTEVDGYPRRSFADRVDVVGADARGAARMRTMDPNFFLLALVLVVLFASISIVGALRRIRDAVEKTLAILEAQAADKTTKL
jgi:hypothetical protein